MYSGSKRTYSYYMVIFFACALVVILSPQKASADMREVSDTTLSSICARSGVTIFTDITTRVTASNIAISDTDHTPHNWIELNGFTIKGPGSDYFHIQTPIDTPITIDAGTDSSGRTLASLLLSHHTQPRTYNVDNLVFCSQGIGSVTLDQVTMTPIRYRFSSHSDGTTGIDFDYKTGITVDDFLYTYNTAPTSLDIAGIHASESASGAPEDPSTWTHDGDFQVGDLDGSVFGTPTPATMDVGTDSGGKTSVCLNLPMKGTVRVEDVTFGGTDFGPSAIDGITVHHLLVQFSP